MNVRNVLIALNIIVLFAIAVIVIVLLVRHRREERPAANQTPFFDDEVLEGRRLERVLGWSLICAAVIAVALPVYWLREPARQDETIDYFDENAIEQGKVLFANASFEEFDAAASLQCANCHGANGEGGSAPAVYTDENGNVSRVFWSAPPLDTVFYRFNADEVRQIVTYGRPGTPMQAFGVAGGGPKNTQSIDDILSYLASIQLSEEEAQQRAADQLAAARTQAADQLAAAEDALKTAEDALAELEADPEASDADLAAAEQAVTSAQADLDWAKEWAARRVDISDGQLLFELNCARCHTAGWSIFDPTVPGGDQVLGPAGGGGSLGFNLRDGQTLRRFPDEPNMPGSGAAAHAEFLTAGSNANEGYGEGGIGSGRMPGFGAAASVEGLRVGGGTYEFGAMLTPEMIDSIVEYERSGFEENDPSVPVPVEPDGEEASS